MSDTIQIADAKAALQSVAVVPKTRTVTLREYHTRGYVFWSSDHEIDNQMGRTCECEVPE